MAIENIVYDELGNVIRGSLDNSISSAPDQSAAETARLGRLSKASPEISQKTKNNSDTVSKVVQSGKQNILNGYRSFTYNFTLAALRKEDVNSPEIYRDSALDFVIARSGGKGTTGITTKVSGVERVTGTETVEIREGGRLLSKQNKNIVTKDFSGSELVKGFNKNSPGRFDLFIENVDIESLMGFTENSSTSLPTGIKFEITEPYSINGFIEAIHVAAVAAGYPSYSTASFLLKMEFIGYPDSSDFSNPEIIPQSTRYFTFGFTGIEVDVNERGTVYRCAGVPFNERGFGQPNKLKEPVSMAGSTVKEILENLFKNVNEQIAKADKDGKNTANKDKHDEYKIKFLEWDDAQGFTDTKESEIGKAAVVQLLKDKSLYRFKDPGDENTKEVSYVVGKTQVQFPEDANLHECIASLIRDSEYVRTILKTIGKKDNPDKYGMIKYFLVKIEIENLNEIDASTKKPFQRFTYVVTPYKIHYTKIPNYGSLNVDASLLNLMSLREYNYIYTGKNVDVLGFKLNFNTLFFEAIPNAMANNDSPGARSGAGNNNSVDVKANDTNIENQKASQNSGGTKQVTPDATKVNSIGPSAGQNLDDPYAVLARNMHQAVVNSKASMISGELEILGDPFFLVTGGIGNYNPKPAGMGKTVDGEANHNFSEVMVTVNFRNPIDISPLAEGGLMYFDSKKVPFSGIYRVTKVTSTFKEGQFKQRLEILRIPGQIEQGSNETPTDLNNILSTSADPEDSIITDTTVASNSGDRATTANLLNLGRGISSPGLPGVLSNFVNATGGLGGTTIDLLSQVSGATTKGFGQLTAAASIFGGTIPGGVDQLATGIRLQSSGLVSSAQSILGTAANLGQAANAIQNSFPVSNASSTMADTIVAKANAAAALISVPGSGIGEGASVTINAAESISSAITSFTGVANSLGSNALSSVATIGANAAGLVNNISDKLASLTSTVPSDPTAIASKFGIDASQLSGMSAGLRSKVLDEMTALSKSIPSNTDLSALPGLVLDYVPPSKLENLPASQPFAVAPAPEVDQAFLADLVRAKGPSALASAYGVSDLSKIPGDLLPATDLKDILNSVNAGIKNPLSGTTYNPSDLTALADKFVSADSRVSSIANITGSVEGILNNVKNTIGDVSNAGTNLSASVTSKFGSLTQGTSPLDKIMKEG